LHVLLRRIINAIESDAYEIASKSMLSWRPEEVVEMVDKWKPHVRGRRHFWLMHNGWGLTVM
jgi:hypothetical protein